MPYSLCIFRLCLIDHAALGLVAKQYITVGVYTLVQSVQSRQEKRQEEDDNSKDIQGHVHSDLTSTTKPHFLKVPLPPSSRLATKPLICKPLGHPYLNHTMQDSLSLVWPCL